MPKPSPESSNGTLWYEPRGTVLALQEITSEAITLKENLNLTNKNTRRKAVAAMLGRLDKVSASVVPPDLVSAMDALRLVDAGNDTVLWNLIGNLRWMIRVLTPPPNNGAASPLPPGNIVIPEVVQVYDTQAVQRLWEWERSGSTHPFSRDCLNKALCMGYQGFAFRGPTAGGEHKPDPYVYAICKGYAAKSERSIHMLSAGAHPHLPSELGKQLMKELIDDIRSENHANEISCVMRESRLSLLQILRAAGFKAKGLERELFPQSVETKEDGTLSTSYEDGFRLLLE